MAFRGRGRGGRFGGGGSFRPIRQDPFILFPEIEDFPDAKDVKEEFALAVWSSRLQKSWNSSPYYYEGVDTAAKDHSTTDIKRYSDKDSGKTKSRPSLSHFIRMTDEYVPAELAVRKEQRGQKRVRWNPESDMLKLDLFEKLEKNSQGQDEKGEKEKKEGEGEEEDDERIEEEEEEFSDDGDYNQNVDFDDDEDDFNMADDNDDEPMF